MSKKTLSGSIALTKLKHVPFEMKGQSGKMVKGIFIPIEANHLTVGKEKEGANPIYININIIVKNETDEYGQNGFISQQGNIKWSDCTDEQKEIFKNLPILGNVKDWLAGSGDDNSGAASTETFTPESNDLPF